MSSFTLQVILFGTEGWIYRLDRLCWPRGISYIIDFYISWLGSLKRFGLFINIYFTMELIGHGAQAKVYIVTRGDVSTVVKERLPKKYRHPELDKKINESRLKAEVKIMKKLESKGVIVPKLLAVDEGKYSIEMELIKGQKVKDYINDPSITPEVLKATLKLIGQVVAQVHDSGIIHGDLTTSNMIMNEEGKLVLVDFGLSYFKESAEDRAVDLYVLERAFKSTHPHLQNDFGTVLMAYGNEGALKKLEVVRQRGRKKIAFG